VTTLNLPLLQGEAGSPAAAAIASKLPDHFAVGHLTDSLLRQAFQGLLCAKLEAAERSSASEGGPALSKKAQQQAAQLSGLEVSFPPLMLQSMKRAWVTSVRLSTGAASGPGPGAAGEEEEAHQDGSATAGGGRLMRAYSGYLICKLAWQLAWLVFVRWCGWVTRHAVCHVLQIKEGSRTRSQAAAAGRWLSEQQLLPAAAPSQ
jgi:hypothetical protein